MRYFTRGWANGELSDDESVRVLEAYQARVLEIYPRLPPALAQLASEISLHDATIEEIRWHPSSHRLRMKLVCIGGRGEYLGVQLTYEGALLGRGRIEALKRVALDREAEVLYQEIDVGVDGVYSHRLLFEPREEVTIDFQTLAVTTWPRADRLVDLKPGFVEELDGEWTDSVR